MNNQIVSDNNPQVKGRTRHPLSSGAYFDAGFKASHRPSTQRDDETLERNFRLLSPAQSRRIRAEKPFKMSVHADMIKVKLSAIDAGSVDRAKYPGSTPVEQFDLTHAGVIGIHIPRSGAKQRGAITGFSRASRKRMIEMMACIRHTGSMLFLTMTYDDGSLSRDDLDFKAEFEVFRRRFERAFPAWQAIWRCELQERKSGRFTGIKIPHYHLIIFTEKKYDDTTLPFICESFTSWGAVVWQQITASFDPAHFIYGFHVTAVRSRKHAYHYVSKYAGKIAEDNCAIGRRWGRIGKFDTSVSQDIQLSEEEYIVFRRLVKRWLKGRKSQFARRFARSSPAAGCSIFGLGDCSCFAGVFDMASGGWQFAIEARRQVRERNIQSCWQSC